MELILERIAKKKGYTIGRLIAPLLSPLGGKIESSALSNDDSSPKGEAGRGLYFCDTLEPTWRDYAHGAYKMKGCSAIPEGRYPVVVTWSPKFRQWLPLLLHVPKFEGIRIHAGNTSCDTEGCILLGENREVGKVLHSRRYVSQLKRRLAMRPEGEPVFINVC